MPTAKYTDNRLGLRVNVENSFTQSGKSIVIIIITKVRKESEGSNEFRRDKK